MNFVEITHNQLSLKKKKKNLKDLHQLPTRVIWEGFFENERNRKNNTGTQ